MFIPPIMVHLGGLFIGVSTSLCPKMLIVVGKMKVLNLWLLIGSHVKGEPFGKE